MKILFYKNLIKEKGDYIGFGYCEVVYYILSFIEYSNIISV